MAEHILDANPFKQQSIKIDEDGFTIKTVFQDQHILDHNAAMRQMPVQERQMGRYVGSIPMNVLGQWLKEDPELLQKQGSLLKKLRDSEYSKLRTVDRRKI